MTQLLSKCVTQNVWFRITSQEAGSKKKVAGGSCLNILHVTQNELNRHCKIKSFEFVWVLSWSFHKL